MFPEYTPTERRIDAAVHIVGLCAIAAGVAFLLVHTARLGDTLRIAAATIYCIGLASMIGASTAYNFANHQSLKEAVRRADRVAIYLMIAGTYTPFALVALGGRNGIILDAVIWLIAGLGIALVLRRPRQYERVSLGLYLALGWIGLPVFGALVSALPALTLVLLVAGGLLYTGGVVFHVWTRLPGQNAIWHGFVLAATACHYVAIVQVLTV